MGDTTVDVYGYIEIQCIRLKSRYNEIQSLLYSLNLTLDTMRYNVSGPSLDTMDTYLPSRAAESNAQKCQKYPELGTRRAGAIPGFMTLRLRITCKGCGGG